MVKIFIDPGHGGTDPGAVGNGIQEKNITLQISNKLREILINEYDGVSVRMSRSGDETLTLNQRTNMANQWGADFLYSIHINSGGGTGYEDYIYRGLSSSSRTAQMQRTIHSEIIARNNMNDRGMKKADFHMLRETNMDAVLTENGFIDNPSDAAKMKSTAWIESVARGHAVGLEKVYKLSKKSRVQSLPQTTATPGVIRYIYTGGFAHQPLQDVHTYLFTTGHNFDCKRGADGSIVFLIGPFDTSQQNYRECKYFLDKAGHYNKLLTREEAANFR
ncbi:N-acetylmuramoyl-L-alanine amidase family protein [Robertmurraya sp. FSL R5-0851]|uniref:N-acetylmuramoyl-L-alanine amidase family protein n=1 Tax=Robertmurraya sp. FSL R5-0851 TaxID=2921584 RepID=UPI0030FA804B